MLCNIIQPSLTSQPPSTEMNPSSSPKWYARRIAQLKRNEDCRHGLESGFINPAIERVVSKIFSSMPLSLGPDLLLSPSPVAHFLTNDHAEYELEGTYFEFSAQLQRQYMHFNSCFLADNIAGIEWWCNTMRRPVYVITFTHNESMSFLHANPSIEFFGDKSMREHIIMEYEPAWFNCDRSRMRNPGSHWTDEELVARILEGSINSV